jgi:hypothetical protein
MSTRRFVILLALVALLGVGLGTVVGSRTAQEGSDAQPTAGNVLPAAQHEAQDASQDTAQDPKTATAKAPSAAASKTKTPAPKGKSTETSAKKPADAPASKDPANDTSVAEAPAAGAAPSKSDPLPPPAQQSEYVFVNRAELLRARNAANQSAAIATLRALSSAQAMAQASGVIDSDGDTQGEYGYFGELAGTAPIRVSPSGRRQTIEPPILSGAFGKVTQSGNVLRSGYVFRMYLPAPTANDKVVGVAESAGGGWAAGSARPGADNCEIYWACYAWPEKTPETGQTAFFVNQEGDILVCANGEGAYSGEEHAPAFDAAFGPQKPGDMSAPPVPGAKCNDGRVWTLFDGTMPVSEPPTELGPATEADQVINANPDAKRSVVKRELLKRANQSTNEGGAVQTLRVLLSAEAQIQSAAAIDTDKDGVGEYAFVREMAGLAPCRAAEGDKPELLTPPLLGGTYATVSASGNLVRAGYVFRVYLGGTPAGAGTPGVCETSGGAAAGAARTDHDASENLFAIYAWPLDAAKTGGRVFFVNQEGDLFITENKDGAYSGEDHAPAFDAAYSTATPGDMKAPAAAGAKGNDGHVWVPAM